MQDIDNNTSAEIVMQEATGKPLNDTPGDWPKLSGSTIVPGVVRCPHCHRELYAQDFGGVVTGYE